MCCHKRSIAYFSGLRENFFQLLEKFFLCVGNDAHSFCCFYLFTLLFLKLRGVDSDRIMDDGGCDGDVRDGDFLLAHFGELQNLFPFPEICMHYVRRKDRADTCRKKNIAYNMKRRI